MSSKEEIGSDKPDGDFFARYLPKKHWDQPWMAAVERVVLVHRLREVIAQVGFTRFESSSPDVEGELEIGVRRAPLAREVYLAAGDREPGRGDLHPVQERGHRRLDGEARGQSGGACSLTAGFDCWKKDHDKSKRKFFGLPYILLHSLSHLLITSVSLECGYPASSIRERIYAGAYGDGILLYTGTSDAEGTMGGLVQAGRQIARHLKAAIDLGPTLLQRPGLCPARTREPARMPVPARSRLPRLPADRRNVLRAAQRLPRPRPGDLHGGRQRRRILRQDDA